MARRLFRPRLQQRLVREFDDASETYLHYPAALASPPFTMAAWVWADNLTEGQVAIGINSESVNAWHGYWLGLEGGQTGDPGGFSRYDGIIYRALSTNSYKNQAYNHLVGVTTASDNATVYLNGTGKATNTGDCTPIVNNTTIGGVWYFDGDGLIHEVGVTGGVCHAAIWNCALTEGEAWQLAHGKLPTEIRPGNLIAYWPLIYGETWDRDVVGGFHMTPTNGPTWGIGPQQIPAKLPFYSVATTEDTQPVIGGRRASPVLKPQLQQRLVREFDGIDQYLYTSPPVLTTAPFTFACWFKPDSITLNGTMMNIAAEGSAGGYWLAALGDVAGDPVQFGAYDGIYLCEADTTTGYVAGAWQHACGVRRSTSDAVAFLNGANKGTDSTTVTPTGLDNTTLGAGYDGSVDTPFTGKVAHAAIWNCALTDEEAWWLAHGKLPPEIRPGNLVAYWPLIYGETWDRDVVGGFHMTPYNSPTWDVGPQQIPAKLPFYPITITEDTQPVVGGRRASPVLKPQLQQRLVREFAFGDTEYLEASFYAISEPFTMAGWVNRAVGVNHTIVSVGDPTSASDYHALYRYFDDSRVRAISAGAGIAESIHTATGWTHACGIWYASNSRAAFTNGAHKATNASSHSITGIDTVRIGLHADSADSMPMSGSLTHIAIWDCALSDEEVWWLAHGKLPTEIRPGNLVAYWPLIAGETWDRDVVGGYHMTPVNSPTWDVGPQKIPMQLPFYPIALVEVEAEGIQWISPANHAAITSTPTLVFQTPQFTGNAHFHIQLDKVATFDGVNLRELKTNFSQTNWEYWDGDSWESFPAAGLPDTYAGNNCRYTVSTPLTSGTWYRRVRKG